MINDSMSHFYGLNFFVWVNLKSWAINVHCTSILVWFNPSKLYKGKFIFAHNLLKVSWNVSSSSLFKAFNRHLLSLKCTCIISKTCVSLPKPRQLSFFQYQSQMNQSTLQAKKCCKCWLNRITIIPKHGTALDACTI